VMVRKWVEIGPPIHGLPGCIMQPKATFVIDVYTIKFTEQCRLVGVPLIVILPCASCKTTHQNLGCPSNRGILCR
jgi:hypothetical protein